MANNKRYYVYVYSDPETRKPFYVGKGTRKRVWDHLTFGRAKTDKQKRIKAILDKGLRPIVEIVQWDLTQEEAHKVEAAFIQFLGIDNLTNVVSGTNYTPKVHADFIEYLTHVGKLRLKSEGRMVLLINARDFYYPGISRFQLYDAIRGGLRVREGDREIIGGKECGLVFAVLDGIVIDVYSKPSCIEPERDMREHAFDIEADTCNILAGEPSARLRNKFVGKEINVTFGSRRYCIAYV